ncbi:MAG TPA: PIG-L family deacetylase [Candidatus Diapherotrites archaeon]|uniref:PIG-L family deacetylase n=1 Tax=Candidatus Iainarchaeum sp. TaxID=3101447 RepID=A0A7J4IVY7_9ARCH|nr:PIG-L family deacetylase [Candidatus Diapherotrites archaeon]
MPKKPAIPKLKPRKEFSFRPLDLKKFGISRRTAIHDARMPNQGIKLDFNASDLFVGKTAVISPHFDDASLNYGGGISKYTRQGGTVHTVVLSPGHRAPIKGIAQDDAQGKIMRRILEGEKESKFLGTQLHYMGMRKMYDERKITGMEANAFYRKLDSIQPTTLVVPGPFDTHPDHMHSRTLALDWAAEQAGKGRPIVIVEAPSMWGSIPETQLTHMLEMDPKTYNIRKKAQEAHSSQMDRTKFHAVSDHKARAAAIIGGELRHGLVGKTPVLRPTEFYSQHVLIKEGNKIVFRRLDEKLLKKLRRK